jgi:glyoxylase-like metal-dependent hydrolase (beta-lactamase superfamily II)
MSLQYTVVSIGALSRNRFWNEMEPKRVAHSTTTIVRDENTTILVDPGLPEQLLAQRLEERTGLVPEQIDIVFLTNFRPAHRRALPLFGRAEWFMHEPEIEAVHQHLGRLSSSLEDDEDEDDLPGEGGHGREMEVIIHQERALLERIKPVSEKLTRRVHLYPCVGVTPGSAGLLLTEVGRTVVVAGDAAINRDYFEAGRVFEQAFDVEAAQESLRDLMEIADVIVPAHDNVFAVAGR